MEQHDHLASGRPGGERVKDQPTGGDLERLDHHLTLPLLPVAAAVPG
jgi:hypothetical protein